MSKDKSQKDKRVRSIANDDSVKIAANPSLESQSSNTQDSQNESDIEQHSSASQESQDSVEYHGDKQYYRNLGLSFDLAYADFEEELRQRAYCRKRRRKEGDPIDTPSGYDETSTTEE